MKTIFTQEEIKIFLMKKGRELHGETILFPTAAQEMENVPHTFQEMVERLHTLGKKEGYINGKLSLMKELVDFFEIEIDE